MAIEYSPLTFLQSHDSAKPHPQAATTGLVILNTPIPSNNLLSTLWANSSFHVCADGGANRLHDFSSHSRENYVPLPYLAFVILALKLTHPRSRTKSPETSTPSAPKYGTTTPLTAHLSCVTQTSTPLTSTNPFHDVSRMMLKTFSSRARSGGEWTTASG